MGSRRGSLIPTRFDFDVHVQEVRPWIAMPVPLVLMWQRGDRRTGVSQTLYAVPDEEIPEANMFRIIIDEHFKVPATLYRDMNAQGPRAYQKKCVIFTLHEATSEASNLPKGQPLARAILDLAEFGDVDGSSYRTILISANRQIASALGAISLSVSVRFTAKKTAPSHRVHAPLPEGELGDLYGAANGGRAHGQRSSLNDEEGAMSTNVTSVGNYDDDDAMTEASYTFTDMTDEPTDDGMWDSQMAPPSHQRLESFTREASPTGSNTEYGDYRYDSRGVGRTAATAAAAAALKSGAGRREPSTFRRYPTETFRGRQPSDLILDETYGMSRFPRSSSLRISPEPGDYEGQRSMSFYDSAGLQRGNGGRARLSPTEYGALLYPVTPVDRNGSVKLDRVRAEQLRKAEEERRKQEEEKVRLMEAEERARLEREILDEVQEKVVEERSKLEAITNEVAEALAGAAAAEERARTAERSYQRLPGELRDAALAELAVYSVVASHGVDRHKFHTPARRIARAYLFSRQHEGVERAGGVARSTVTAMVLAARACGDDTSRLVFWWSNAVMLREAIQQGSGWELPHLPEEEPTQGNLSPGTDAVSADRQRQGKDEHKQEDGEGLDREQKVGKDLYEEKEVVDLYGGEKGGDLYGEESGRDLYGEDTEGDLYEEARGMGESPRTPNQLRERIEGNGGSEHSDGNGVGGFLDRDGQRASGSGEMDRGSQLDGPEFREEGGLTRPASGGGSLRDGIRGGEDSESSPGLPRSQTEPRKTAKKEVYKRSWSISQMSGLRGSIATSPLREEQLDEPAVELRVEIKKDYKRMQSQQARETWGDATAFTASIKRLEEWLHSKVLHLIWTQVFIPLLQRGPHAKKSERGEGKDGKVVKAKKSTPSKAVSALSVAAQTSNAMERWTAALEEGVRRLCPVRAQGGDCGCLPALSKQIMEHCVGRLDVALFNAMLRNAEDMNSTDPLADPLTDPRALLFPVGQLNFSHGLQLKIAVSTWTDVMLRLAAASDQPAPSPSVTSSPSAGRAGGGFLPSGIWDVISHNLPKAKAAAPPEAEAERDVAAAAAAAAAAKPADYFPHVKAMGDLLMLPKAMLSDANVRKEVCGLLSLQLIRRIIYLFVPDGSDKDYVSPSLMAAINAEVKIQLRTKGSSTVDVLKASPPPTPYIPPPSQTIRPMLGSVASPADKNTGLVLEKGEDSDEEFGALESPLDILSQSFWAGASSVVKQEEAPRRAVVLTKHKPLGYKLLKEVWTK